MSFHFILLGQGMVTVKTDAKGAFILVEFHGGLSELKRPTISDPVMFKRFSAFPFVWSSMALGGRRDEQYHHLVVLRAVTMIAVRLILARNSSR